MNVEIFEEEEALSRRRVHLAESGHQLCLVGSQSTHLPLRVLV